MDAIQKFAESFGMKYEQFNSPEFSLANKNLAIPNGTCLYFNLTQNTSIDKHLKRNYQRIVEDFSFALQKFVFLPKMGISHNFEDILNYYIPAFLTDFSQDIIDKREWVIAKALCEEFQDENHYIRTYQEILSSIGYNGGVRCGFLFCMEQMCQIVEIDPNNFFFNSGNFYEALILFLKSKVDFDTDSRDFFGNIKREDVYDGLDEETKSKLKVIQKQLDEIRNSGQLLLAMPAIRRLMSFSIGEIDEYSLSISNVHIDPVTKQVFLTDYNNMEIKMSHLTRAVYILFYNNPQGIDLQEIKNYRDELLNIYTEICPFENLDKIRQSIDDIVNLETKSIYTHISRIKSAFMNVIDYEFAKYYIVAGSQHGDSLKYIYYRKNNFDSPFEDEDDDRICY